MKYLPALCILAVPNSLFLAVSAGSDDATNRLGSPQCLHDLNKKQIEALHHFNGIFGDFRISLDTDEPVPEGAIYGPLAAVNITSSNYGINTFAQKSTCDTSNRILKYGLVSGNANVGGDVFGDVWTNNGHTDAKNGARCQVPPFRLIEPEKNYLDALWSFAPTAIRETSKRLAELRPDTAITAVKTGITSTTKKASFEGYRILKLPACSDGFCSNLAADETHPDVFKGDSFWANNYGGTIPRDEMIVFNVPVYVGSTFTISTEDVTKNISPCQVVYNFYAVDKSGSPVNDTNAYFTLIRSPGVIMKGTILAPQARIVDASTGYFGGQLITLQSYEGKGASIKDFASVSNNQCSSQSLCWPQGSKGVVEAASNVAKHVEIVHATPTVTGMNTKTAIQGKQSHSVKGKYGGVEDILKNMAKVGAVRLNDNDNIEIVTKTAKETVVTTEYHTAVSTSTIVDVVVHIRNRTSQHF